ncbi:Cathepsin L cysteine proteinase [Fasciolopsis buskii]|uniref:Cathepsin L cysteine proteinase n=1 Tax=Fasciolopsis buskii TaxID=27845 RepID=A0A8E0S0G8_9TREM|nr:Cathepsin L cysteine proteinase [Fasciolopsis buski]
MKLYSVHILTVLFLCFTALSTTELYDVWEYWKSVHGKRYASWEESLRFRTWLENIVKIQTHNLRYQLGMEMYDMKINEFADLSWSEFAAIYLCNNIHPMMQNLIRAEVANPRATNERNDYKAPDSIDWRTHGLVRRVKDQGQCGSCWAFSATGSIEGQFTKRYGVQIEFSEQQLVDCSGRYGNEGCFGGLMVNSFRYLRNHSLETETDYPYKAEDRPCKANETKGRVKVKSYTVINNGSEIALKELVGTKGPVSVGITADNGFQFYSHGIYFSSNCSIEPMNHGVLVVGYGTEGKIPYWIVKNSWGVGWGENGYIRMARDRNNMCHIASMASIPEVVKI